MTYYWDVGDRPTVFVDFTTEAGEAGDPDDVVLALRRPDATLLVVELVDLRHPDPDSGHYEYDVAIDQAGMWAGEWRATGSIEVTEPFALHVRRSRVGQV